MLKLTANQNLSKGGQVKTNPSTGRAGSRGKKSMAGNSAFAEIALQMVAIANKTNPTADAAKTSGQKFRVGQSDCKCKPESTGEADPSERQAMKHTNSASQKTPANPDLVFNQQLKPDQGNSGKVKGIPATVADNGLNAMENAGAGSETNMPRPTFKLANGLSTTGSDENQGRTKVNHPKQINEREKQDSGGGESETELNKDLTKMVPENKSTGVKTELGTFQGMTGETNRLEIDLPPKNAIEDRPYVFSQSQKDVLLEQMVKQIKTAPSLVEVQLRPEIMGKVNILVESKEGAITISIAAQNSETANMLNSNLAGMRSYLEQQGINLQQMEVNLGYRESRDQSTNNSEKGDRSKVKSDLPLTEADIGCETAGNWRIKSGLNILA